MDTELLARQRVSAVLDKLGEDDQHTTVITLTDFEDEECFAFLMPGAGWTLDEWRAVNRKVAHQLRESGKVSVSVLTVTLAEYFAFLARHDLANTPETRAQFHARLTHPEPKTAPARATQVSS